MSMARCDGCDGLIDTDNDCECYVTVIVRNMDESIVARPEKCLCGRCRDSGWHEIEGEEKLEDTL